MDKIDRLILNGSYEEARKVLNNVPENKAANRQVLHRINLLAFLEYIGEDK